MRSVLVPGRRRVGLQVERRWLVLDQVLELVAELLQGHPAGRRELRQLVSVLEVVAPETEHVAPRDARSASSAMSTMRTMALPVSGSIISCERDRHEMPALDGHQRRVPPDSRYFAAQ